MSACPQLIDVEFLCFFTIKFTGLCLALSFCLHMKERVSQEDFQFQL